MSRMNRKVRFVARHLSLSALALVVILFPFPAHSAVRTSTQTQNAADQDCEKIKQEIQTLQESLAKLTVEAQAIQNSLDDINKQISRIQQGVRFFRGPGLSETARGEALDQLAKAMNGRTRMEQDLQDIENLIQSTKDEIADLLSKLANCAPPSTTEPPKGTSTSQMPPPPAAAPSAPPTPSQPPSPSPAPTQQPASQDCETIKQEIQALQDSLAKLTVQAQAIQNSLDDINKQISTLQQGVRFFSGPGLSETARGEALDQLAKAMNDRTRMEQDLQDIENLIQSTKDEIADLLSKLANCGPPSAMQPPKQETPTDQPPTRPPSKPTPSSSQTSMSTTGAGIQFQLRGFGGATIVSGNAPGTAGFDGAVLFPVGNRILVGPTAGFQWINSSIVNSIGSQQPGSTFIHTSAGFKQGNFGGRIGFPFGGWQLGIHGGATVAGSSITQQSGFCGLGNATSPAGCTVLSTTTTHDTIVGPFVGGYISHSIFSHVGVFVGYDYHFGLKDTRPNPTNPSGPRVTILDLHYSDAVAGIVFSFGRHSAK